MKTTLRTHRQQRLQPAVEEDSEGLWQGHVPAVRADQSEAVAEAGAHAEAEDVLRAGAAKRTGNRAADEGASRASGLYCLI